MEAVNRLKDLLSWSDRLGSDEIYEIKEIVKLLEQEKLNKKSSTVNTADNISQE